jgi:hypothetical protein
MFGLFRKLLASKSEKVANVTADLDPRLDVDVVDQDRARALLMRELIKLEAPDGTELHYTKQGAALLDRLVNGSWNEGLARTFMHPGFGV